MPSNIPDDLQQSNHWDDNESSCSQCGQTVTEINRGEQLQCDDKDCNHIMDNNKGK